MTMKSANVAARVEPEIKEQAEHILAQLGISASGGINMFYRQVILSNGLPFRPSIPSARPKTCLRCAGWAGRGSGACSRPPTSIIPTPGAGPRW